MSETRFEGRLLVLSDDHNQLIKDIDTDQIFHNAFLHITDMAEMGPHAMGNLEGWKTFPQLAKEGDVVVAGPNFGAGSSRQQAVDCFRALGVRLMVAESFGAIYKRNAINSGMPILVDPDASERVRKGEWKHLQRIRVDLEAGTMTDLETKTEMAIPSLSRVQRDILEKGTLLRI